MGGGATTAGGAPRPAAGAAEVVQVAPETFVRPAAVAQTVECDGGVRAELMVGCLGCPQVDTHGRSPSPPGSDTKVGGCYFDCASPYGVNTDFLSRGSGAGEGWIFAILLSASDAASEDVGDPSDYA